MSDLLTNYKPSYGARDHVRPPVEPLSQNDSNSSVARTMLKRIPRLLPLLIVFLQHLLAKRWLIHFVCHRVRQLTRTAICFLCGLTAVVFLLICTKTCSSLRCGSQYSLHIITS
ncbi:unnamed protein product [Polarella glacialis]|uniref:Uncharacterized protein n=1 Tax=Polarella glacialis TaxID=89957 RepID=A0A813HUH0_POLGL|nr:unnamed protein product [Polarella glacialis]